MNKDTQPTLHFYQGDQLHTALGETISRTLFRNQHHPLAEQQRQAGRDSMKLLATDAQDSVLQAKAGQEAQSSSYTVYGNSPLLDVWDALAGFNGECRDLLTGCYLLGKGYRAYSPVLMRFHGPDSYSPFGEGGINTYMYCAADPVNYSDPTGHMYRPNYQQPLRGRGVSPPPLDLTNPTRISSRQRHNPISQSGRTRQPNAGPDAPIEHARQPATSPVPRPSISRGMQPQQDSVEPIDLRRQTLEWRIVRDHHKPSHPENKDFVAAAAQELAELKKTMQSREAIVRFMGKLNVELPEKTYRRVLSRASST